MRHATPNFLQIEVLKFATESSEAFRRLQERIRTLHLYATLRTVAALLYLHLAIHFG